MFSCYTSFHNCKIEGNRIYVPCIYVLNKIDQITLPELDLFDRLPHYVPISAHLEWNLDELLAKMWEYLQLVRMCPLIVFPFNTT